MKIPPNQTTFSSVSDTGARGTRDEGTERMPAPALMASSGVIALDARLALPAAKPRARVEILPAVASDETLFAAAASGDRDALAQLIERYKDFLFGLLVPLTNGDTHRAEDLFQDTFLNAMRAARTFDAKKAFRPWVTAIAVNLARDDARRKKVRGEVALDGSPSEEDGRTGRPAVDPVERSESPAERAERVDEEHKVRRALGRLTQLEREVVLLHFYNDLTLQETAVALRSPLGTIKSRLHAALMRLSGILEKPE
jgi:RNA polymerase sigma-70 factor (ECF subfamily)